MTQSQVTIAPLQFSDTPASIVDIATTTVKQSRSVQDALVASVTRDNATFENTVRPLADDENWRLRQSRRLVFYQDVSPDAEVRRASADAEGLFNDFDIESHLREDLFALVDAVHSREDTLKPEDRRLLEHVHRGFAKNGLQLPSGTKRERFVGLKKRIQQLATSFTSNLNEANVEVWCSTNDLGGLSTDFVSSLKKNDGEESQVRLTGSPPHLNNVLKYATKADVRKRLHIAHNNKVNENVVLLREVLVLRDEAARLLGYPNHATFRLEDKMIKSPETINHLLENLRTGLSGGGTDDVRKLSDVKKQDLETSGQTSDNKLYLWDQAYFERLMIEKEYSVDQRLISEYFSFESTLDTMLGMFSKLFGMSFRRRDSTKTDEIETSNNGSSLVWHEDVLLFDAWDEGGDFLGHLYIDPFPRDGKFGHMANFNLRPGYIDKDGHRVYPATALVCNYPKPTASKPSLLNHQEVWTLFHELGHGIHDLVSQTHWARFHGTNVVQDFCEAPSQMLENWCWDKTVLKTLSQHYSSISDEYLAAWRADQTQDQDGEDGLRPPPPAKLSDEMIDDLLRTKHVNRALFYLRQLHVAIFDMSVHQPNSAEEAAAMNTSKMWNELRREITGLDDPQSDGDGSEWGHGEVVFGHLMQDYDAGYYGYISSQVYALDMFHTFFKDDPMNEVEGRRYRKMILEKGGAYDEMEILKEYLGREPKPDAFYRELGLEVDGGSV